MKSTKKMYGQEKHARQQLNQNNVPNTTTVSKSSLEFHENVFGKLVPKKHSQSTI